MQEGKNYIVAYDLGSSQIVGAAGHRDESGQFVVDAVEVEKSAGCIKRGRVINISDAKHKVLSIRRRLENRISPSKISQVYVGVGGQSIRSVEYPATRALLPEVPINEDILKEMSEQVRREIQRDNLAIFDVLPGECRVDDRISENPCGECGSNIRISYRLVVGNIQHKRNLEKVFELANLKVAGYITTANATAEAVLSANERKQGCALLDCGAETTTLSIYRDGYIVYLVTIPLGGNNITRDILSLHLTESEAETLKCNFRPETEGKLSLSDEWAIQGYSLDIKSEELKDIIDSRLEEIVLNVKKQIEISHSKGRLESGIFLVGGASQLNGLRECLSQETKTDVFRSSLSGVAWTPNQNRNSVGIGCFPAVGLLLMGKEICAAPERPAETVSAEPTPGAAPTPAPADSTSKPAGVSAPAAVDSTPGKTNPANEERKKETKQPQTVGEKSFKKKLWDMLQDTIGQED